MRTHALSRENCDVAVGQRFTVGGTEFTLAGSIGDGAVGLVRKATGPNGATVAVKFLAPDPKYIEESNFDDVAARFKREGERGAKLDHLNLMKVLAAHGNGNAEAFRDRKGPTNPFIVMEYLQGSTVEGFIRRTPENERGIFDVTQTRLIIAIQLASAIEYLHKKKLIHRDIKPANIFLSHKKSNRPVAKLGDFGIMKWGDFHAALATGALTATAHTGLGTLKYMSPEQAIKPKDVTVKTDIYSLGITLFELFTGQILAGPHHVFEVMMARLNRGTTASRYMGMGYNLGAGEENVAAMILDMHLRGAAGRPPVDKLLGILEFEYERRFHESWQSAIDL